uniref:Uncharacterized protein n=1 Tax=Oryza brachyantha TaxID=4533 RepID=J3N0G1_ORYBR
MSCPTFIVLCDAFAAIVTKEATKFIATIPIRHWCMRAKGGGNRQPLLDDSAPPPPSAGQESRSNKLGAAGDNQFDQAVDVDTFTIKEDRQKPTFQA